MYSSASSVTVASAGKWTLYRCKNVTKKMKNSVRARLSPGQVLLPTENKIWN